MNSSRVLVTGANGFLGNNVIRELIKQNYKVLAFVRTGSDASILAPLDCKIVRGDYMKPQDLDAPLKECNYVIHCASLTTPNIVDFKKYEKANVTTTKLLVEACKRAGIERFIYVSSANAFTGKPLPNPGNETSGFMQRFKSSGYAYSKYLAQTLILKEVKEKGFPALVVAPSFLIGPYDPKPSSGVLLRYIIKNKIVFYPRRGGKSFVDVGAVAAAIVNAITQGDTGECYLLTGVNMTYKDFYRLVSKQSSQQKIFIPVPGTIRNITGILSSIFPIKKLQVLHTNLNMVFFENYFTNQKAKTKLNMPQTNLPMVVAETIDWFRKNGYLQNKH